MTSHFFVANNRKIPKFPSVREGMKPKKKKPNKTKTHEYFRNLIQSPLSRWFESLKLLNIDDKNRENCVDFALGTSIDAYIQMSQWRSGF